MIQLTCTHCQMVLSIDEGFAGGVCRCQHCGTIQTVPAHLKSGSAVGVAVSEDRSGSRAGQKSLFQTKQREIRPESTGSGTGLEDLAGVVASSGLSNSGLSTSLNRTKKPQKQSANAPPTSRSKGLLLFVGGALAAVAICIVLWLVLGRAASAPDGSSSSPGETVVAGPTFIGVPLKGSTIAYVLDRGESARDVFDSMKEATFASIATLGAERKFQVLLWDNHTDKVRYPTDGATFANPQNLDACKRTLENVVAYRQSDIAKPLQQAMNIAPDSVVIVTAKGAELDDSFATDVLAIRKDVPIRLYTISLKGEESPPLKMLAEKTGGVYKVLTDAAVRASLP